MEEYRCPICNALDKDMTKLFASKHSLVMMLDEKIQYMETLLGECRLEIKQLTARNHRLENIIRSQEQAGFESKEE